MAGFNTAAFAAQDALTTALQARAELAAWQIDFGLPPIREPLHLWVDESVEDVSQTTTTTGIRTKDETFTLTVFLYVRQWSGTALELRDEIKGAAAVVQDVIGDAPFLSGSVLFAEISAYAYETAYADAEGRAREGVMKLSIACTAYLTA